MNWTGHSLISSNLQYDRLVYKQGKVALLDRNYWNIYDVVNFCFKFKNGRIIKNTPWHILKYRWPKGSTISGQPHESVEDALTKYLNSYRISIQNLPYGILMAPPMKWMHILHPRGWCSHKAPRGASFPVRNAPHTLTLKGRTTFCPERRNGFQ